MNCILRGTPCAGGGKLCFVFFSGAAAAIVTLHAIDCTMEWPGDAAAAVHAAAARKAHAQKVFFGGKQPRCQWLCVDDASFGEHSLRTYFPQYTDAEEEFAALFKLLHSRDRPFAGRVAGGERMFKADRSEGFGSHTWVAFGTERPTHCAAEQVQVCTPNADWWGARLLARAPPWWRRRC